LQAELAQQSHERQDERQAQQRIQAMLEQILDMARARKASVKATAADNPVAKAVPNANAPEAEQTAPSPSNGLRGGPLTADDLMDLALPSLYGKESPIPPARSNSKASGVAPRIADRPRPKPAPDQGFGSMSVTT